MFSRLFLIILSLCVVVGLSAQDLQNLGGQKAFTISGGIGGAATFYTSNEIFKTQAPFTWNLNGNFTPTFYGFALPFSFVVNQYGNSYTSPFAQFGISPTYKWAKLLLGYRNISMSPFTFDGQTFEGVGVELNPGLLRFAAFYGSLNKAINEDTTTGRLAMPQYGRKGMGVKLGVGTAANHFDLLYFHAKDDSSSVRLINTTQAIRPEENTVLGASFKLTLFKRLIWTGDGAVSALTQDQGSTPLNADSASGLVKTLAKVIDTRYSTVADYAGQTLLTLLMHNLTVTAGYRRVGAGFQSLGTPYMLSDLEAWQGNASLILDKGKVNLNANLNAQHNDLEKDEISESHNLSGVFTLNAVVNKHINLNMNFSDVILLQTDGTQHISDSVRQAQAIYTFSLMPSFIFPGTGTIQTWSPSFNYSFVNDLNPVTAALTNSKTYSGTLNYVCSFIRRNWSLNGSLLYNQYVMGQAETYTSYGINAGAGLQLLKEKNLGFQGNLGYLLNQSNGSSAGDNLTGSLNVRYSYKKHHSFSLYFNSVVTPPNSSAQKNTIGVTTNNQGGGISYNYSF